MISCATTLMSTLPTMRSFDALAERNVHRARPHRVEILLAAGSTGSTRYSGNAISQNVVEDILQLCIRLVDGPRSARVVLNQADDHHVGRAIESARAVLRAQRRAAGGASDSLDLPAPQSYTPAPGHHPATARATPRTRGDAVARTCRILASARLDGAGSYETGEHVVGVANSRGLRALHRQTTAVMSVTARTSDGGAGWAETVAHDAAAVDPEGLARRAAERAVRSRKPRAVRPGPMDVILEPSAVAELLSFLGYLGFGALGYLEGRGPLAGKLGAAIADERITIDDDAYHPVFPGVPFDFEGIPRKRVRLVDRGVFSGVVHDRATARRMGTASTGHSLPRPNTEGPVPMNLVVRPGDASVEEMVASTRRGILVTQLHYTNLLDPGRGMITGMTRNGTFLLERGRVTAPVRNLRFTENLLGALSRVSPGARRWFPP
jgi:predicted Zn-dependent protease